jgi:hypothetical protein
VTTLERVSRVQRMIATGAVASAVIWGVAAAMGVLAITILMHPWLSRAGDPRGTPALIELVVVTSLMLWRVRHVLSRRRVALWLEEKLPDLQYALVTAIDPAAGDARNDLDARVGRENLHGVAVSAIRRKLRPAIVALILMGGLLYISPAVHGGRPGLDAALRGGTATSTLLAGSKLEMLTAEVVPPAYTRQSVQRVNDPELISALTGSVITIRGRGQPEGITARLGDAAIRISGSGGQWTVRITMPSGPGALRLTDRRYDRIIVLESRNDQPPKVVLVTPVHDTTLRTPKLVTTLHAELSDDIGLGDAWFEYLISSGSGETFTGRTINTPVERFGASRGGSLTTTVDLSSLKLGQGDVVSIRAIAHDLNTLSGPGMGTSDTRTIRIARADEYDSLSVEAAAPPAVDSSAMSQRMLIMMTEALVKKEKALARAEWVKQSSDIGATEDRIRKRVYDILYEQDSPEGPSETEEAETEIRAIRNPDLKQAYDALWQAVRSLQIAEPREALPPMRVALKALDRARLARRMYLRGAEPKIIVDLERVRLTGKEKGTSSSRAPHSFADSTRVRLVGRFDTALDLIRSSPARALTELALIRAEALASHPAFASALGEATAAMRAGRDATPALVRARRALETSPEGKPGLPVWTGGW